jgi:hypothetical protein
MTRRASSSKPSWACSRSWPAARTRPAFALRCLMRWTMPAGNWARCAPERSTLPSWWSSTACHANRRSTPYARQRRASRGNWQTGVELHPGERLNFLLIPGPEKARAWELVEGDVHYDRAAYRELLLRAIESIVSPVGVDRGTLETWLLANAGYWGPPGVLPPPGVDVGAPLLAGHLRSWIGVRPVSAIYKDRQPVPIKELLLAA